LINDITKLQAQMTGIRRRGTKTEAENKACEDSDAGSKYAEENLNAEDAKDDEERATDEDDVSNWTQRRQQRLDNKLQARSPTDDSA